MAITKTSIIVTGCIIFLAIAFLSSVGHYTGDPRESISNYINHSDNLPSKFSSSDNQFNLPPGQNWTHIIWQTSKYPSEKQKDKDRELASSWAEKNPYYRHEMITHERMVGYIGDAFHDSHPELEELYMETTDYMLRTDVIRFLLLLNPIDTWLSPELKEKAGVVIGVEFDNDLGPDGKTIGGSALFQFCAWTIMAKPNQPFIRYVVNDLIKRLANVTAEEQHALTQKEVLQLTGPAAMTKSFLAYASEVTGTNVSRTNFSRITEPMLLGEVAVLPIWSFGGEHQVVNSGFENDGKALVKHWFANSWKTDHKDG